MSPEVIILIGVVVFFAFLFFGVLWQIRKLAGFIYVNTKVALAKINDISLEKILQYKDDKDAYRQLKNYLEISADTPDSPEDAAAQSQADYAIKLLSLKKLSPKDGKKLIGIFINRWEARQVYRIYAALQSNKEPDTKVIKLLPKDSGEFQLLKDVAVSKSHQEAHHKIRNSYLKAFFGANDAQEDDASLEKELYSQAVSDLKATNMGDAVQIMEIFQMETDIKNALTLIKSLLRKDFNNAVQGIIPTGTDLQEKILAELSRICKSKPDQKSSGDSSSELLNQWINIFKGSSLEEAYKFALEAYNKENIAVFEKEFNKAFMKHLAKQAQAKLIGPIPLLTYIYQIEERLRNLLILSYVESMDKKTLSEMIS